jgi:hypothetical protein
VYKIATIISAMAAVGMASAATAVTPLTTTVSTTQAQFATNLQTATVNAANSSFTKIGASPGTTVNLAQFNTNTGILIGARATVNTSVFTTAQVGGNSVGTGSRTVTANVTQTGSVAVAGVTFNSTAQTVSRQCSGGNCANSPGNNAATSITATISGTTAVPTANLAAYAGTGTIGFTNSASGSTRVTTAGNAGNGTAQSFMTFGSTTTANNTYSIAYDYVNFANPSFSSSSTVTGSSLDFGTLLINSGLATLNFSITNIGNINTAGLSLTSITRSTNNSQLASSITTFTDGLDGGFTNNYTLNFNPLSVGAVNDIFTFNFIDFAPAGSVGARSYQLNLAVSGNVFDPVPEPSSWMMMLLGFGLVGAVARRRAVGQPG